MKIEHKLQTGAIAVALFLSVTTAFLYVHDTMTGDSLLASALDVVGFCPFSVEGATGSPGPTGATGATGSPGPTGAPGVSGDVGEVGSTGAIGSTGTPGSTGATGSPGEITDTGITETTIEVDEPDDSESTIETADTEAPEPTDETDPTGAIGECALPADIGAVVGDLVPAVDNVYELGSSAFRWKGIQLGPGTLYIEDKTTGEQAAITIDNGSLLIDGVDSLWLGNIQVTSTGIRSMLSDNDITIGAIGDTGFLSVATGIRFSDGSTMESAPVDGVDGADGTDGLDGADATILPYADQIVCVVELEGLHMYWGTCESNKQKGTEYRILAADIK
jgi:hypothetical protein